MTDSCRTKFRYCVEIGSNPGLAETAAKVKDCRQENSGTVTTDSKSSVLLKTGETSMQGLFLTNSF